MVVWLEEELRGLEQMKLYVMIRGLNAICMGIVVYSSVIGLPPAVKLNKVELVNVPML